MRSIFFIIQLRTMIVFCQIFTLNVQWAKDNGRAREFIKKKHYTKAKVCFECGVFQQKTSNSHFDTILSRRRVILPTSVLTTCQEIVQNQKRRRRRIVDKILRVFRLFSITMMEMILEIVSFHFRGCSFLLCCLFDSVLCIL